MKFWNIFKWIIGIILCIILIFLAINLLLELKEYIAIQKDTRPMIYRTAEYYNVNPDGQYLIRDELGYIWQVGVKVDRDQVYLIKVNLGQDYYSKGDDLLESLWIKIQ